MSPPTRAAILVRLDGTLADRQQRTCLDYCAARLYAVESLCVQLDDAAMLAEAGAIDVVVAAYDDRDDAAAARRIRAAGARLEYVRAPRRSIRRVGDDDLAVGMHQRGAAVEQIADFLKETTREIRALLRRAGIR